MKSIRFILCLFTLTAMPFSARLWAAPGWRNIGPGGGGWVPCVAVSPVDSRVVYAGCDVGGFYKSSDGGNSWRIYNSGLRDYYVETIVPHPNNRNIVYIGTQGGVHKSVDGGRSWTWLRNGFPPPEKYGYSAPIGALAIDPENTNVLYAGIGRPRSGDYGKGAVYRSDDAGDHWTLVNPSGGGMEGAAVIWDLAVHPRKSGLVYAATNRGLYRSDASGATWRRLSNGLPGNAIHRIALCRNRPETMYVSVGSSPGIKPWRGGVYRSDDGGENWIPRNDGLAASVGEPGAPAEMTSNIDRLVVDPSNPDNVFAGDTSWVSAGVYHTDDGGKSWKIATEPRDTRMDYGWITMWGPSVMGLAMDPRAPNSLYFSTSGHLFRTTDGGSHWECAYTRPATRPSDAPESLHAWWSTTGLETTCINSVAIDPKESNHLFVCYFDIGLLQSFDGGNSFAQTVSGMAHTGNTFAVAFDPANPNIVYAGTGEWGSNHGDVCRSDDGGIHWRVVGKPETGLPDGQTRYLVVDANSSSSNRRTYVGVEGSGVYGSENGGESWHACNSGLPVKAIRGLMQHPTDPKSLYVLLNGDSASGGGIYKSTDHGTSWQKMGGEFEWSLATALAICPKDAKRLYVAAREEYKDGKLHPGGVFASVNGGATWRRVLADQFIQSLAVDPRDANVLYAGGADHPYHDEAMGSGVFRSRDGGQTWESLNTPDLSCRNVSSLTVDPTHLGRIYAGTGGNGVFVYQP